MVTALHQGRIRKGSAFFIPYHYYFPKEKKEKEPTEAGKKKKKEKAIAQAGRKKCKEERNKWIV
ncbi:hypothetical protein [Reichenbachiella faecimaris]|uniref:hypothetical protein n=1 Tax=Reichenbachiella faecimaris TaxID=692418 RepID=UPI0009FC1497|nr:hypothetical protein [Reichenbachiella faecimaris]